MRVNSRRLLPIFQSLLPEDHAIFRSNVGDFAICRADDPASAIAFLSGMRPSHRALRIDGWVGRAVFSSDAAPKQRKTLLTSATGTHILNVRELRERTFLDEQRVEQDVSSFVSALDEVLRRVRSGEELHGMRDSPRTDIFIAPLAESARR